jgi:hypothetical protein
VDQLLERNPYRYGDCLFYLKLFIFQFLFCLVVLEFVSAKGSEL